MPASASAMRTAVRVSSRMIHRPGRCALDVLRSQTVPVMLQVGQADGVHGAEHEPTEDHQDGMVCATRDSDVGVERLMNQPEASEKEISRAQEE